MPTFEGTIAGVRMKENRFGNYLGVTVQTDDTRVWFRRKPQDAMYSEDSLGLGKASGKFFGVGDTIEFEAEYSGEGDGIIFVKDVFIPGFDAVPPTPEPEIRVAPAAESPRGTFTVVFGDGQRRTVRIDPVTTAGQFQGWTFYKYLYGPDNDNNFRNFAYAKADGVFRLKRGVSPDSYLSHAVQAVLNADPDARHKMGVTWASASGNCYVCGRTLTVPESIQAGIGPDCAGRLG